jgi:acetoin utilization deacetylase AcuC-like enzyme/GNAT superfamily N-acetyltransferase
VAIGRIQQILQDQFTFIRPKEIEKLPRLLANPQKYQFRPVLFVSDNIRGEISGFALLLHEPALGFCYLDYISAARNMTGRGVGGALYERVREEASMLGASGLFFECLPDDPRLCKDPAILKQNQRRLRFYERYGARPMIHTKYETPVDERDDNPPYLVVDTLGKDRRFSPQEMREIVRVILEGKYADLLKKAYVEMVVASITDDPVQFRPPKYVPTARVEAVKSTIPPDRLISLVYNSQHLIHHVQERGYVEAPVRVETILASLNTTGLFEIHPEHHFGDQHVTAVHDKAFVDYLQKVCFTVGEKESVYPYVFPIRNVARPPKELEMRAGYYCIDTFTPLNKNAYLAARHAVDCALTAAQAIFEGSYLAYALVRPPGHHAENKVFGGFCYLNSTAIAANYLSGQGKVAILDIDYHHGNGQQNIFYRRSDVLTISIHGHPRFAYPFFSGFAEETGEGQGAGFNVNYPLAETIATEKYVEALEQAIHKLVRFAPEFLVVALGFDTARGDPTGSWGLVAEDFERVGRMIGELPYPTLFVQEGGYRTRTLGRNARYFFQGVWRGSFG